MTHTTSLTFFQRQILLCFVTQLLKILKHIDLTAPSPQGDEATLAIGTAEHYRLSANSIPVCSRDTSRLKFRRRDSEIDQGKRVQGQEAESGDMLRLEVTKQHFSKHA